MLLNYQLMEEQHQEIYMEVEMSNLQVQNIKQYIQHQEHHNKIVMTFQEQAILSKKVMQFMKYQQAILDKHHGIMAQEIAWTLTSLLLATLSSNVEAITMFLTQVFSFSVVAVAILAAAVRSVRFFVHSTLKFSCSQVTFIRHILWGCKCCNNF